ncbi:retrovirus-related pol polyprotein from transposon TNT 1-94 [Tanacetum coccineum]
MKDHSYGINSDVIAGELSVQFSNKGSFNQLKIPLALGRMPQFSSIQHNHPWSYYPPSNEPSPADNFQLDSGSSSTENLIESLSNSLALLTQSYKSHLPQTNNQLRTSSNARNKATVQDGRVVVQDVRGRYNANNQGKPFQRNNARGNVVAGNVGGQNRGGIINPGPAKPIKCYNCNGLGHIARECPRPKRLQDSDYFKDKMLLMQAQENGAVLDEEQSLFLAGEQIINFDEDVDNSPENDLALNMDHIFEADECDAFDSDVDEGPTTQTMFMTNLTSEDRIYDEAGPSYDSNTPFEVQDHDTFVNHLDEYHEVHEMQTDEQHNYVVDSDADYTSNSNIIPYDQYVEDNEDHVVQRNVSSVRNDALMSILDEMHEQGVQSRLANKPDMIINDSVTSELARYKELVGEYEKRAKFELTDRERKIDEQMRIIISDRNRKETSLKSKLHSAQILLSSTVGHYKSKTEEVIILKKDFKQKEDKFLEEFLDIKRLKDKIEDRLYKQDQSVQTVHMLCKPKSFYDEKNKVAIGYKNPLCLTRAKQAQSALYNGYVLVTTNHTPTVIHDSDDTREIAEITRKRMLSSTENLIESLSNTLALLTQSYKSHLPQTNNQLRASSNARNKAMVQDGKVVVQDVRGRYNATNQGRPFQRNNARGNGVAGNVGGQNRGGMINPGQAKPIKCYNCNGLGHIARECPRPKRLQDSDYFKDKMLLMQAQESGAVLDEEQSLFLAGEQVTNVDDDVDDSPENDLALNVDHVFEADECDAFDSDVDEGPTSQTMFMANLTSEDPIYDEAGPSYDSNNPFEVTNFDDDVDDSPDHIDEYHEVHEMQNDVQHNYVVDSNAEDNKENGVQSNVSSVQNDALMSIINEMHEEGVQQGVNKPDMVVNDSLTSELARYKELVGEYEKRAKFELTDREQKINEQMRIIISVRNRKETSLKSELHSVQILLNSTVGHYKSKTEEVTILKKDFKQKEDKFLEEFLDIKRLKDKIEDRLYKQDQSVQTVHMLCKPKSFYNEKHKDCPPPPDYSKENFLATFAPQRNLTPEQIFWSIDDNNRKKAETLAPKPILALTVYPPNTPVKLVPRILPTKSQIQEKDNVIRHLKDLVANVNDRSREPYNAIDVTALIEQNDCDRVELEKVKQHYKELYDSIKITQCAVDKQCAEIEKKNLLIENENLIVNCLLTQLLYDVEKSRCLDLEADMSKVHDESKLISKLEREYINL